MSFDYGYVLPPTGPAQNDSVREMFDDIKLYVNSVVPSGGAAPFDAKYVTLGTNTTLTVERVLTGTTNQVILTDNGAGSTVVLSLPQSIANTSSPSFAGLLYRNSSGNTVTVNPPSSFSNYVLTLPSDDGTANQFLQTDGSGVLSWADVTTSIAANRSLSNLSSVAINASLVPGTSLDIGSSGAPWHDIFINRDIVLFEEGTSNSIIIKSPPSLAGYTLLLPDTSGSANYVLKTDGLGTTSWVAQTSIAGLANYDLSNLNVPAVNVSIKPGTTNSIDLGSNSKTWRNIYTTDGLILVASTSGDQIVLKSPSTNVGYTFTLPQADGVTNDLLTNIDGAGTTSWIARSALGLATTALGNLSSVAINTSLLPAFSAAIDVGSSLFQFRDAYLSRKLVISKNGGADVTIQASTSGSFVTPYTLTLPIDDGNASDVLQTDGSGVLSWVSVSAAGGATKALDNLASVAINTSLLAASDNAIDLGSTSKNWRSLYVSTSVKNGSTTLATATELGYLTGVTSAIQTQFSGKASTALGNLASVAINTSLLPSSDNAIDLGSSTKEFRSAYLKTSLIFQESGAGTHTITLQAPSTLSAGYTLTLPVDDGTSNQVLTTDGSGVLSWTSSGSLSGTVSSGTAGRLALYNTTSTTVGDTYVQNAQNINVVLASHATLAATRTYTIPDAGASASVVLTETSGTLILNGSYRYSNSLSIVSTAPSLTMLLSNTSNVAGQKAILNLAVGASADDPFINYTINSTTDWSTGIDNSDSDKYKVSKSATLGTNDYLSIDTSGNLAVAGNFSFDSASHGIVGASGAAAAATGNVGETLTASAASVSVSASATNITSLSITAGVWLVFGTASENGTTGAATLIIALSANSASLTGTTDGLNRIFVASVGGNGGGSVTRVVTQNSSNTYYLVGQFDSGTHTVSGSITALRIA